MRTLLKRAVDKIDVSEVVLSHVGTLYDARAERPSRLDRFMQFGLPLLVALTLAGVGVRTPRTAEMLGVVSFLGGFLFALLILVLQMATTVSLETERAGVTKRSLRRLVVLRELSANVGYCVLICLVAAVVLLLGTISVAALGWNSMLRQLLDQPSVFAFSVLAVLGHLLITLLMILKRIFTVTNRELDLAALTSGQE